MGGSVALSMPKKGQKLLYSHTAKTVPKAPEKSTIFFLSIPVMFGASFLKLVKYGFHYTGNEVAILVVGMVVAFIVSILAIKFLLGYIKNNDFKAFGVYRIILGIIVAVYFFIK